MSNNNFHCQTPLKRKIWLIWQWKLPVGKIWLRIEIGKLWRSYRLQHAFSGNSEQLQRHDSVHLSSFYTVYRCRFFSSVAYLFGFSILGVFWFSLDCFVLVLFALVVLFLVSSLFSTTSRYWLGRTSSTWFILCRVGRKETLTQSQTVEPLAPRTTRET